MAKQPIVCILLKADKTGRGPPNKEGEEPWQCNISRGELVVEIPGEERVPEGKLVPNFRLHSDPEVVFFASPTDIIPLDDNQLYYLLAVQPASVRMREFMRAVEMNEKMALVVDDMVTFKLSIQPKSAESHVNGIIRYIGPLSEQEGLYFGIEILEEQYRGKGTSNGRPNFNCGPNNAVYVAMDKIVRKSQHLHNIGQSSLRKPQNTISDQKSTFKTSQNPSADNTRSKDYPKSKPVSTGKVKEMVQGIHNPLAHAVDDSAVATGGSQFQPGQRVVLQSLKGNVIPGTVRWVGPIKVSKDFGVPPIPIVGIETDQKIDPDEHFPDLHINVTTSFGKKLFKTSNDHSRVFLPEQLVLHADSYAQKRQEEHDIQRDAELAKQFCLSVAEYHSQKELMKKAADFQRDCEYGQKVTLRSDPLIGVEERAHQQTKREKEQLQEQKRQFEDQNMVLREEKRQLQVEKHALEEKKQQLERQLTDLTAMHTQLQQVMTDKDHVQSQLQSQVARFSIENMRLKGQVKQLEDKSVSDIQYWEVSHSQVLTNGVTLGEGGWGKVLVGLFQGQKVALKMLHSGIVSPYYNQLVRREICMMAKVRHPNLLLFVAAVLDHPSGSPVIITELLDTSLRKAYQDKLLTNDRMKLCLMTEVASALNYLHCHRDRIIHRDVSSANVLLEARGGGNWKAKLSDFGSANLVQYSTTTGPGAVVYAAPEVPQNQTPKMDVYSYGILLCEVLVGEFPFPPVFPGMLQSLAQRRLLYQLILSCTKHSPDERPDMDYVLHTLNEKFSDIQLEQFKPL